MSLLEVRDLEVQFRVPGGAVHAVDGATFDVDEGSLVGLVGESGCGKTTMARAITRVIARNARIVGGSALFEGRDLMAMSQRQVNALRWRDIAFIPQSAMNSLDPVYRVEDQLLEVLRQRGGLSAAKGRERARELFEMVGIAPHRLRDFPHQFSGGMRQRVAIALALALNPKLVIADEPVTALDVIVQRQILDTLKELQQSLGISVILVTHDVSVVAYICDKVVVMYAGQVVESGPTDLVLTKPFHPYTMGLYNAFPDLNDPADLLTPIEGHPPDLRVPPEGCRFAPRCPFALPACSAGPVPLKAVAEGHEAACIRSDEVSMLRERAREAATWQST